MKLNIQNFTGLVNRLKPNIANGFRYINFIHFVNNQNGQRKDIFLIKTEHNLYPYTDQLTYAPMGIVVLTNDDESIMISDTTQRSYGIQNSYELLNQISSSEVPIELYQKLVNQLINNDPYKIKIFENGNLVLSTANDQLSIVNGINYLLNLRALLFSSLIQKQPKGAS